MRTVVRTIDVTLKPAFDTWLAGTAAGQPLENVFGAGGSGTLAVGLGFGHDCHVYLEYERTAYSVWDPLESTCRHASLSIL